MFQLPSWLLHYLNSSHIYGYPTQGVFQNLLHLSHILPGRVYRFSPTHLNHFFTRFYSLYYHILGLSARVNNEINNSEVKSITKIKCHRNSFRLLTLFPSWKQVWWEEGGSKICSNQSLFSLLLLQLDCS